MNRLSLRTVAVSYLLVMIVIPLAALIQNGSREGLQGLFHSLSVPAARHALYLTLWTALVMTVINTVMGTLTAFTLVRYDFPGKDFINRLIDLPFAIPTMVTGVMLVSLYGPHQALGGWLKDIGGWQIAFAPSGIVLALLFVSLPFVVRCVQPVLLEMDPDQEEAARSLGAGGWTVFWRVLLPSISPGIVSGACLSFSRALGEFGVIIVVAGNIPFRTQTVATYVLAEVESHNQLGASAMSLVLVTISFALVLAVDMVREQGKKKHG